MSQSANQDDLTIIKGIGKVRQQWLRDHLQVQRLADLAALDPAIIEKEIAHEHMPVSLTEITRWVDEAAFLSDTEQPAASEPVDTETAETRSTTADNVSADENTEAANRGVSIEINVTQQSNAEKTAHWQGDDLNDAVNWLQTVLAEPITPSTEEGAENGQKPAPIERRKFLDNPVSIALLNYTLSTSVGPLHREAPFVDAPLVVIEQDSTFDIDMNFALNTPTVADNKILEYQIGLYISPIGNRQAGSCISCDTSREAKITDNKGQATLHSLALGPGEYNTWLYLKANNKGASPTLCTGPRFIVI